MIHDLDARAEGVRERTPGIAAGFAFERNRSKAPRFFAGLGVIGADETFLFAIRRAGVAAQSLNQPAFHRERAAGVGVLAFGAVADGRVPNHLAVAGVERHQMRVAGGHENLVVVDRDAAHGGRGGIRAVAILPDQLAGLRVQRLQHHAGVVHVQHAVVHDGRGLVAVARAFLHGPTPHQTQIVDVLRGDLVQRAVVGGLVIAANHQPIAGIGIAQHGVGDRNVVLDFTRHGDSAGRLSAPVALLTGWPAGAAGAAAAPACKYAARCPDATLRIETLDSAASARSPGRALLASRMNAARLMYVWSGERPPAPGGMVARMKPISSPAVLSPHCAMKLEPASCGPSRPERSGRMARRRSWSDMRRVRRWPARRCTAPPDAAGLRLA